MNQYCRIYEYENLFFDKNYILPVGKIRQISELSISQSGEIAEHIQACDEITYVISGNAMIMSGETLTEIKAGQIHYIAKDINHQIIADKNQPFRYICIGLEPNENYKKIESFMTMKKDKYFFLNDDGIVKVLTELLINEIYSRDNNSDILINDYISHIFIALSRLYKRGACYDKRKKNYNCEVSRLTFYDILRYIDREYLNIERTSQVAEYLSYSENYISHLFKDNMGITMKEYLIRKKINTAMELLVTSNLKISEISEYLNFNNAHTFYQAFKKITSVSPMVYKKNNSEF